MAYHHHGTCRRHRRRLDEYEYSWHFTNANPAEGYTIVIRLDVGILIIVFKHIMLLGYGVSGAVKFTEGCTGKFSQVLRYSWLGKYLSHSLMIKLRPTALQACACNCSMDLG